MICPMLLNDLFIVDDWRRDEGTQPGDGTLTARLHLRFPHPIFDGHFPGRPVLPGACLVQLATELAPALAGTEVRLIRAGQIKFISMIDPLRDGNMTMTLTVRAQAAAEWQITAEGINAGTVCFRFKGVFQAGSDYAE
jgi:3-hydroxyacyl-[acyl-carrier-protein] dehydratase